MSLDSFQTWIYSLNQMNAHDWRQCHWQDVEMPCEMPNTRRVLRCSERVCTV
jgi:hypothetical protein